MRLTPGNSRPVGVSYGTGRFPHASAQRLGGLLGQRGEDRRERPGESRRPAPPLVEGAGPQRHGELADGDVRQSGAREQGLEPAGVGERKGARDAGGGTGRPRWTLTASKTMPSQGLRSRGPQTASADPSARSQHPSDLARGAIGIGGEHEPLTAEHHVVGVVGLVDLLEIELAGADVRQPERLGARRGDRGHLGGHVGHDDLAAGSDAGGGGQSRPARPAGQLEHPLARRSAARARASARRRRRRARPRRRRARPRPAPRRPTSGASGCAGSLRLPWTTSPELQIEYSFELLSTCNEY